MEGAQLAQRRIHLSSNVSLPVDVVTESIAALAIKRAGKSSTIRRLVEQLYYAGQQVVVLDPKGDWWGIQFGRDGKSPGLPFVIVGGEHGQVPLTGDYTMLGEIVARMAAVERVNMVIDLGHLRKHELAKFGTFFLETLYRLKAKDEYRTPMMLVVDEADAIAPQQPIKSEGSLEPRMLGAAEDIVRRGGQRGIGIVMATQRSAVLNKNVLTQCGILLALRTVATQDIKPIDDWVEKHGTQEQYETLVASLPSLPNGTGWIWSSHFPEPDGIFKKVAFDFFETFDSFATPKVGEKRIVPKNAADVDLEAFKREMAATFEKAKQEDPKELQRQLRDLRAELKKTAASPSSHKPPTEDRGEITQLKTQLREREKEWVSAFKTKNNIIRDLERRISQIANLAGSIKPGVSIDEFVIPAGKPEYHKKVISPAVSPKPPVHRSSSSGPGSAEVGAGGLRRILTALAQCPNGLTKQQIGVRAGLSSKSGSFGTYLGKARSSGWVEDRGGKIFITNDAGLQALGPFEELPTGRALLEYWLKELGNTGAARMLQALYDSNGAPISKSELGERTGLSAQSGSFGTYLGRLRSLELLEGPGEALVASDIFYE
jgi:uncharacterized protein